MNRSRALSAAIVGGVGIGVTIIACGGNNKVKLTDSKVFKDAPVDTAAACKVAPSYAPTSFPQQLADSFTGSNATPFTNILLWKGVLQAGSAEADLGMEAFSGGGSGSGMNATPDWPTGNVTPKANLDLATAPDVFLFITTNFSGSGQAQDFYFSTAGTLNITAAGTGGAAGSNTAGNASNVVFGHFDPNTGQMVDNCMTMINSVSFTSPTNLMRTAPPPEITNFLNARMRTTD